MSFDDHLTPGAVACALSHHKALRRLAQQDAEWGLILEDDVALVVPQVHRELEAIVAQLPAHWTAVFLGYHNKYGRAHARAVNSSTPWQEAPLEQAAKSQ